MSKAKLVRHSLEVLLRLVGLVHRLWHLSKNSKIWYRNFFGCGCAFSRCSREKLINRNRFWKFQFLGPGWSDKSPRLDPGGGLIRVETKKNPYSPRVLCTVFALVPFLQALVTDLWQLQIFSFFGQDLIELRVCMRVYMYQNPRSLSFVPLASRN